MMGLSRFSTRFVLAVLVAALVILAHSRQVLQLLQLVACCALVGWGVLELRSPHRRHSPKSVRPS